MAIFTNLLPHNLRIHCPIKKPTLSLDNMGYFYNSNAKQLEVVRSTQCYCAERNIATLQSITSLLIEEFNVYCIGLRD